MYCDLREGLPNNESTAAGLAKDNEIQENTQDEVEILGKPSYEPYEDQKNLDMLPDVGFFKKLK